MENIQSCECLSNDVERDSKVIEQLILFVLGVGDGKVSKLHLQKILFALWKSYDKLRYVMDFSAHIKGPYSVDLDDVVQSPIVHTGCWGYVKPAPGSYTDRVLGGFVVLTPKGKEKYDKIRDLVVRRARDGETQALELLQLLSAVELLTILHKKLEWDELLLLLYTDESAKDYVMRSQFAKEVIQRADQIIDRLIRKGVYPESARELLKRRVEAARWAQ